MLKKLFIILSCVFALFIGSDKSQAAGPPMFHISYHEGWGQTIDFQLAWWFAPNTMPTLMTLYKLVQIPAGCQPVIVDINSTLEDNVTYIWRVYYKNGFEIEFPDGFVDPNYFSVVSRWNNDEASWDHGVLPIPHNAEDGMSVVGVDYKIRASYDPASGNTYLAAYLYDTWWELTSNLPMPHHRINQSLGNPCHAQ